MNTPGRRLHLASEGECEPRQKFSLRYKYNSVGVWDLDIPALCNSGALHFFSFSFAGRAR